jgi:hypothetical protein
MAEPNIRPDVEESPATPVNRSSVNAMPPSVAVCNPSAVDSTRTTNRQRFQLSEMAFLAQSVLALLYFDAAVQTGPATVRPWSLDGPE